MSTTETANATNATVDQAKLDEVTQSVLAKNGLTADNLLPAIATLDLSKTVSYDQLDEYMEFHKLQSRYTEIKLKKSEMVLNVLIVGNPIEKTLGSFFESATVFLSPKNGKYDKIGVIALGVFRADVDVMKTFTPKLRQFLLSEVDKLNAKKAESTALADKRNQKHDDYLMSLIKSM